MQITVRQDKFYVFGKSGNYVGGEIRNGKFVVIYSWSTIINGWSPRCDQPEFPTAEVVVAWVKSVWGLK